MTNPGLDWILQSEFIPLDIIEIDMMIIRLSQAVQMELVNGVVVKLPQKCVQIILNDNI